MRLDLECITFRCRPSSFFFSPSLFLRMIWLIFCIIINSNKTLTFPLLLDRMRIYFALADTSLPEPAWILHLPPHTRTHTLTRIDSLNDLSPPDILTVCCYCCFDTNSIMRSFENASFTLHIWVGKTHATTTTAPNTLTYVRNGRTVPVPVHPPCIAHDHLVPSLWSCLPVWTEFAKDAFSCGNIATTCSPRSIGECNLTETAALNCSMGMPSYPTYTNLRLAVTPKTGAGVWKRITNHFEAVHSD